MTTRSFLLSELALAAGLDRPQTDCLVKSAQGLSEAGPGDISFARSGTASDSLMASRASALILWPDAPSTGRPELRHANPRYLYCLALGLLRPADRQQSGIHETAVVAESCSLGADVSISPYAVIGAQVQLGDRVRIGPHAVIGDGATIAADCIIEAHAVVYGNVSLGNRCHIHAGAVVGAEGFGFEAFEGRVHRMPHIGVVNIGDDVEIGALTAIDRATTGATVIGSGSKLDNLVQIGHNTQLGRHCIVAGQSGIAGSSRVGDGVVMGGRTSLADHAIVGDGAQLGGSCGVYSEVPAQGMYSGEPARPHRQHLREIAALGRLPELLREMRGLESRLRLLEEQSRSRGES